jgi:L-lactate permease
MNVFHQVLAPTGNMWSTILLALVPLAALLFMLAVLRMTAWLATIIAGVITVAIAVWGWHAPLSDSLRSYLYGGLQGAWTIDWITFWGLIIFNTLVLTGDFDRFKTWMVNQATVDVRIQTLMLAWAFGALLEGLVGFGYPWAVVVPILVGLGIADLEAIRVAALANNAPVSYGPWALQYWPWRLLPGCRCYRYLHPSATWLPYWRFCRPLFLFTW